MPCQVSGQKGYASTQLFKSKTMNFEQLGIGGLDKQFEAIFRRAFASRVFPPAIIQKLGIKHVKVKREAALGEVDVACPVAFRSTIFQQQSPAVVWCVISKQQEV
jgi:hypothetical protein